MKTTKKKPLTYDDIKLNGRVLSTSGRDIWTVCAILNEGYSAGIDEPVFVLNEFTGTSYIKHYLGLKYVLKYYIPD